MEGLLCQDMAFEEKWGKYGREGRSDLAKVNDVSKYLMQKRIWLTHETEEGQGSRAQRGRRGMQQSESGGGARSDPAGLSGRDKTLASC